MVGKMTKTEKIVASLSFALLMIAIVLGGINGTADMGNLVILSFTGILMWLIFFVCAFFPADWRMTEKQKNKIDDLTEYQNKYRKIMIGIDVIIAIVFAILVLVLE